MSVPLAIARRTTGHTDGCALVLEVHGLTISPACSRNCTAIDTRHTYAVELPKMYALARRDAVARWWKRGAAFALLMLASPLLAIVVAACLGAADADEC